MLQKTTLSFILISMIFFGFSKTQAAQCSQFFAFNNSFERTLYMDIVKQTELFPTFAEGFHSFKITFFENPNNQEALSVLDGERPYQYRARMIQHRKALFQDQLKQFEKFLDENLPTSPNYTITYYTRENSPQTSYMLYTTREGVFRILKASEERVIPQVRTIQYLPE